MRFFVSFFVFSRAAGYLVYCLNRKKVPALFVLLRTSVGEKTLVSSKFPVKITLHREHTLLFQPPIGKERDSPRNLSLLYFLLWPSCLSNIVNVICASDCFLVQYKLSSGGDIFVFACCENLQQRFVSYNSNKKCSFTYYNNCPYKKVQNAMILNLYPSTLVWR